MKHLLPLALAATLAAPGAAQTDRAQPVVLANETIIRVQGEGEVSAPPEIMTVSIGVTTTGATAAQALDANNRKLAPVLARLREEGIPASDIQTSGLDVEPQFAEDQERDEDRIVGFRASNAIAVETRDLTGAGALISVLFDAGANTISGPLFGLTEASRARLTRAAEAAALEEGRAQAEATAQALGMRVGRLLLVSDSEVRFRDGSGTIVVTGSRIAPTPIEPGEVTVEARYSMEFTLVAR